MYSSAALSSPHVNPVTLLTLTHTDTHICTGSCATVTVTSFLVLSISPSCLPSILPSKCCSHQKFFRFFLNHIHFLRAQPLLATVWLTGLRTELTSLSCYSEANDEKQRMLLVCKCSIVGFAEFNRGKKPAKTIFFSLKELSSSCL